MDKFCHAPWMHIYTNPDGRLMPCCLFDDNNIEFPNLNDTPIDEALNHPKLVAIRKQILNNEVPAGCYKCEAQCNMNQHPYRQRMTNLKNENHTPEYYNSDGTLDFDSMEPTYLDIRFGNLCNLKCRTCRPGFSSSIAAEFNKMFNENHKVLYTLNQDAVDSIYSKLATVKNIYLAGGEPLLEENNYKLLQYLIENNLKPMLSYNTNLTTISFKNINYFELWNHFPNIEITVSIDGYKEVNDYIRFGSKYEEVIKNIEIIRENVPQAVIIVNTVASNMSMFSLPALGRDLIERNAADNIMFSICHAPAKFDPTVLTLEAKREITKDFEDHIDWLNTRLEQRQPLHTQRFLSTYLDLCKGLVDYMNSQDNSDKLVEAKRALAAQDVYRNTDFTGVLKL